MPAFEERTQPGSPEPWPDLRRLPPAPFVAEIGDTNLSVNHSVHAPEPSSQWGLDELIVADSPSSARLAGSPKVQVKLDAWRAGDDAWLDPDSGTPLAKPSFREISSGRPGSLTFRLSAAGLSDPGEVPFGHVPGQFRFGQVSIFDRQTGVELSGVVTRRDLEGHGLWVQVQCEVHHRCDLLLEVRVYDQPGKSVFLAMKPGAEVDILDRARLSFVHSAPWPIVSTGMQKRGTSNSILRTVEAGPSAPPWTGSVAAIVVWPHAARERLLLRPAGAPAWPHFDAESELTVLRGQSAINERLEARMFERASRLQFQLARPSTLPEVEDLLDVPLGRVTPSSRRRISSILRGALQMQVDESLGPIIGESVENATPRSLLQVARRDLDARSDIEFDPANFTLTEEPTKWFSKLSRQIEIWLQ